MIDKHAGMIDPDTERLGEKFADELCAVMNDNAERLEKGMRR